MNRCWPATSFLLLATALSSPGAAYPVKVLHIMAPAAPGGGWDRTARAVQTTLAKTSDGRVQVYNVPGAGGLIGLSRMVRNHAGDPHRLMVAGRVMLGAAWLNRSQSTLARLTPIATLSEEWEAVFVPADSNFRSMNQLLDAFRSNPRSIAWGGGSAGGVDHMLATEIGREAGIPASELNYIAHSGGGEAVTAMLSGAVTAGIAGVFEFRDQVAAGRLRVLAVSSAKRLEGVDAPTLTETGLPITLSNWRGVFAPPGVSREDTAAIVEAIRAMHDSDEWRRQLQQNRWTDFWLTGSDFARFLEAEQLRVKESVAQIQSRSGTGAIGAGVFPIAAVAGLLALTIAFVFRLPAPVDLRWGPAALVTTALVLYAAALPAIGYVLATTPFFAGTARLLGSRRAVRDVGIGLALSSATYIVFSWLQVSLPGLPGGWW
jgi:putative tricarboxylic transport membrane protein